MKPANKKSIQFIFVIMTVFLLVLAACNPSGTGTTVSQPTKSATAVTPSATPAPTALPDSPAVILIAPQQADGSVKNEVDAALKDLSGQAKLSYGVLEALKPEEVTPSTKLIVVLSPDSGLAGLAQALPAVMFVGVGITLGDTLPANVDTLVDTNQSPEIAAFTAGYISALITNEWRGGVLGDQNTPAGQAEIDGFLNGREFFCGLCLTQYPPFLDHAPYVQLQAGSAPTDSQSAVDALIKDGVKTAFIPGDISTPELLTYAAQQGIAMIGTQTPPDDVRSQWVVTLRPDLGGTIRSLWPDLISGKAGLSVNVRPGFADVNEGLLTKGKQRLVNEVLDDLMNGNISARTVSAK